MLIKSNYCNTCINSDYIVATNIYFNSSNSLEEEDVKEWFSRFYEIYNRNPDLCTENDGYIEITVKIEIDTIKGSYDVYSYTGRIYNINEYHRFIKEENKNYNDFISAINNSNPYEFKNGEDNNAN